MLRRQRVADFLPCALAGDEAGAAEHDQVLHDRLARNWQTHARGA